MWNKNISQKYTSENTSINNIQYPSTVKRVLPLLKAGSKWADIGGGKFDNVKNLFSEHGSTLWIYDPYNRSEEHNQRVIHNIENGQCDGVMVNNVLNVVLEKDVRMMIIHQAFDVLKKGGHAFFKIYEGNGTGIEVRGSKDSSSYQSNQKASFYIPEIEAVFGSFYCVHGDIIRVMREPTLEFQYECMLQKLRRVSAPTKPYDNIGKVMGTSYYIHKQYSHLLPSECYQKARSLLESIEPDFVFDIVKFDTKKESVSFIQCKDFDVIDEPSLQRVITIHKDGTIKKQKEKEDPQIYHHKWLLVGPDYQGFNIIESMQRSYTWKKVMGVNAEISSRIGTQSYWKQWLSDNHIEGVDNSGFSL